MDRLRRVAQLVAAPDANRRAAVSRALYFFASPVRAGELQTLGSAILRFALTGSLIRSYEIPGVTHLALSPEATTTCTSPCASRPRSTKSSADCSSSWQRSKARPRPSGESSIRSRTSSLHRSLCRIVPSLSFPCSFRSRKLRGREAPQLWTTDQISSTSSRMDPTSRPCLRNCSRPTDHTKSRRHCRRSSSRTCCDSTRHSRTP